MTFHPWYCYTHTDRVYATNHRIELKNNVLTLLLLTIMTKNHSCYWSSLVWHFHFLWLCYKLILFPVSCHKFEIKLKLKEMGKVNNSGYIQHLKLFKLSKCKQHSCVRKKKKFWINGQILILLHTCYKVLFTYCNFQMLA